MNVIQNTSDFIFIQGIQKIIMWFQKLTNISHRTRTQLTLSTAETVQASRKLPAVLFLCLLREQFPRWHRSRRRLSVCFVLRCPLSRSQKSNCDWRFISGYCMLKNWLLPQLNASYIIMTFYNWTGLPPFSEECESASQSCSSTTLDWTCCKWRQPPSFLASSFAGSYTLRFILASETAPFFPLCVVYCSNIFNFVS